jgi:hypothetical protein
VAGVFSPKGGIFFSRGREPTVSYRIGI